MWMDVSPTKQRVVHAILPFAPYNPHNLIWLDRHPLYNGNLSKNELQGKHERRGGSVGLVHAVSGGFHTVFLPPGIDHESVFVRGVPLTALPFSRKGVVAIARRCSFWVPFHVVGGKRSTKANRTNGRPVPRARLHHGAPASRQPTFFVSAFVAGFPSPCPPPVAIPNPKHKSIF